MDVYNASADSVACDIQEDVKNITEFCNGKSGCQLDYENFFKEECDDGRLKIVYGCQYGFTGEKGGQFKTF